MPRGIIYPHSGDGTPTISATIWAGPFLAEKQRKCGSIDHILPSVLCHSLTLGVIGVGVWGLACPRPPSDDFCYEYRVKIERAGVCAKIRRLDVPLLLQQQLLIDAVADAAIVYVSYRHFQRVCEQISGQPNEIRTWNIQRLHSVTWSLTLCIYRPYVAASSMQSSPSTRVAAKTTKSRHSPYKLEIFPY